MKHGKYYENEKENLVLYLLCGLKTIPINCYSQTPPFFIINQVTCF